LNKGKSLDSGVNQKNKGRIKIHYWFCLNHKFHHTRSQGTAPALLSGTWGTKGRLRARGLASAAPCKTLTIRSFEAHRTLQPY